MSDAQAGRLPVSGWDQSRQRKNRKGLAITAAAILAAHTGLVVYLYKTTFAPAYLQPADKPAVNATIIRPEPLTPPPPPPPHPSKLGPIAHPRATLPPPVGVQTPEMVKLPFVEKQNLADLSPPRGPADARPPTLTNAQFDRSPDADDLAQYYPERANRLGKEGGATIRCTVSARGALVGCSVVGEDPVNFGFGEAALKLSKLFKLKPATSDGMPVDGGSFVTKITFKLPE